MPHFADRIRQRALSERKNRIQASQSNTYMLSVYANKRGKSKKKQTRTARGKQNAHPVKKQKVQDQFPSFAVSFKSNHSQKLEEKGKEAKVGRMKFLETRKVSSPLKVPASFEYPKDTTFGRLNKETDRKAPSANKRKAMDKYLKSYNQAIEKVFKCLDIFNRGRISEANINKWIPESALYFLGSVFQKIRQERLALTREHFIYLCQPVMYVSSEEDLKVFIEDVNGKDTPLDVSIEVSSPEKHSIVIGRASEEKKSQVSPFSGKREVETRLGNIEREQKRKNKMVEVGAGVVERQKSKKQIQPGQLYNSKIHHFKQRRPSYKQQIDVLAKKVMSSQKEGSESKIPHYEEAKPVLPVTFNSLSPHFKDPQVRRVPEHYTQRNSEKTFVANVFKDISIQPFARPAQQPVPLTERPNSNQAMRKSQQLRERCASARKAAPVEAKEQKRIDRLSDRLEEYIRFNKQKIERNAKFIRENSKPKV